jgi:flavin-dependent dehydrogenase
VALEPAQFFMNYDAIIIGGGPGGSTAATALAQAGKRVLILEWEWRI